MMSRDLVEAVTPLVEQWKQDPDLELEICLGVLNSKWSSKIPYNYFSHIFQALGTNPNWSSTEARTPLARNFFQGDIRGTYNPRKQSSIFVQKTRVAHVNIACDNRNYDLRVNLKREKPVPKYVATTPATFVRLQERWSFIHKNTFRYDLSKVACGLSKELACNSPHFFEVEIELVRNISYTGDRASEIIAQSLVEKGLDLLGRYDKDRDHVPLRCHIQSQRNFAPVPPPPPQSIP